MKDFLLLDEILDKQKIHLNKAFEEGYKAGYKDGYGKGYEEVKTMGEKAIILPQEIRCQIIVDEETGRLYKLERFEDKRLVLSEVKPEEMVVSE